MATPRATTRSTAHRDEEVKEQVTETLQRGLEQGKEMLASVTHDAGDKALGLALLTHCAVNMWQGWSLLWNPDMILPGLFGFVEKFQWPSAHHALVRAFGMQTLAMGLVAGGAAFRYDAKHKALLNAVLLLFHALCVGDFWWNKWGSAESSGFRIGPGFFHVPMLIAHSLALLAYNRPDTFFSKQKGY